MYKMFVCLQRYKQVIDFRIHWTHKCSVHSNAQYCTFQHNNHSQTNKNKWVHVNKLNGKKTSDVLIFYHRNQHLQKISSDVKKSIFIRQDQKVLCKFTEEIYIYMFMHIDHHLACRLDTHTISCLKQQDSDLQQVFLNFSHSCIDKSITTGLKSGQLCSVCVCIYTSIPVYVQNQRNVYIQVRFPCKTTTCSTDIYNIFYKAYKYASYTQQHCLGTDLYSISQLLLESVRFLERSTDTAGLLPDCCNTCKTSCSQKGTIWVLTDTKFTGQSPKI